MKTDLISVEQKLKMVAAQMVAERAKVDLFYFCKYILGYGEVMDARVHGPLCRNLRTLLFYQNPEDALKYEFPSDYGVEEVPGIPVDEQMPSEEAKAAFWEWEEQFEPRVSEGSSVSDKLDITLTNLLALLPRGTLKSSIITIAFAMQWNLNYGEDRILIDSEVFEKSKGFLAEIKGHYQDTQALRDVYFTVYGKYPDEKKTQYNPNGTEVWSTEKIVLTSRTRQRKEPTIDCSGIGVSKNGMHYDLIIMDDLHSEQNTKNAEQIETVKDHYKLMYSLLEPGHPAVVVGTRWNYNDLYQMIIDEEKDDFNFITRSAESMDGDLFYEKRLNRKQLKTFRKRQGAYLYSCQYLNNPVDDESATFKKSMFKHISMEALKDTKINWYGLVDPSWKGEYSDYAVIMIAGMDARGEIYCRYIYRQKLTYAEIVVKMFEINAMYSPRQWLLETVATQKSIQYFLEQEQKRQTTFLRVKEIKGQRAQKEERIMALAPYYELGRAHHLRDCPQIEILESELMNFPRSKYDDVSDCWAGILEIATPPSGVVLSKEKSDKRKEYLKMLNKPKSPMVGY
jgi:predicted phage terminase large subunit-like protein